MLNLTVLLADTLSLPTFEFFVNILRIEALTLRERLPNEIKSELTACDDNIDNLLVLNFACMKFRDFAKLRTRKI